MEGNWWQLDREFIPVMMPLTTRLDKNWNSDGDEHYVLTQYDHKNIITLGEGKINAWSVLKRETLKEAEDFLLNGGFSTNNGEFYSIRKIYF